MKELANTHQKELAEFTDLDLEALKNVTYLHDFDREVQYVVFDRSSSSYSTMLTVFLDVRYGDIPPNMRTTGMPHLQTPCCQSESPSWQFMPLMTQ